MGWGLLGAAQEGFRGEQRVVFVGRGGWNHKVWLVQLRAGLKQYSQPGKAKVGKIK